MNVRGTVAAGVTAAAALLIVGGLAAADELEAEQLRCAAGFGCEGLAVSADDAQVLLGFDNAEAARDSYAARFPDRYVQDAFPAEGEPENPVDLSETEGASEAIDLFDGDPSPDGLAGADRADQLRCASGYGCQGLAVNAQEAQVLLGLEGRNDARDAYALEYPEKYTLDAHPAEGQPENPIDLFDTAENEPSGDIDLFDGDSEPDEPIDLFPDADKDASPGGRSEDGPGGMHPVDFTRMEGYAETPCAGTLVEQPEFMNQPGISVASCLQHSNGSPDDCGMPAARFFCLTAGRHDVACYGIGVSSRAMNAGLYCDNGNCSSFSFIVCK